MSNLPHVGTLPHTDTSPHQAEFVVLLRLSSHQIRCSDENTHEKKVQLLPLLTHLPTTFATNLSRFHEVEPDVGTGCVQPDEIGPSPCTNYDIAHCDCD